MIKTITTKEEIEFIGVIKNKLLCIKNKHNLNLLFIDLKHFEIVLQKEENISYNKFYCTKVMNDFILQFKIEKHKLKMKKYSFNFNDGSIEDQGLIENNLIIFEPPKISFKDDSYLILSDYFYFNILKIEN